MNTTRHLEGFRPGRVLALTMLAVTPIALIALAPAASAYPAPDGPGAAPVSTTPATVTVTSGSPIWMFVLVAVVAAVLTVVLVLAAVRILGSRRLVATLLPAANGPMDWSTGTAGR